METLNLTRLYCLLLLLYPVINTSTAKKKSKSALSPSEELVLKAFDSIRSHATAINIIDVKNYSNSPNVQDPTSYNPCCAYPCLNRGICMANADGSYVCDCEYTGYYGVNCEKATLSQWFKNLMPNNYEMLRLASKGKPIWNIVNKFPSLRKMVMKTILGKLDGVSWPSPLVGMYPYVAADTFRNLTYHARTLPPVPSNCPTAMGVKGVKVLPDVDDLVDKLFRRRQFIPSSTKMNLLFPTFAQHFTHMFFKTDYARGPLFTWGDHNIWMSNIYGQNISVESYLREYKGGRMLTQKINGEEYPPFAHQVKMPVLNPKKMKDVFAMGHPFYVFMPTLALMTTFYLREHNRVAGILQQAHTNWDDERLFQTTRNIILGETLKIIIEDYVQHLSNSYFHVIYDPTILHGTKFQFQNHIHFEFNMLYHWHQFMPDEVVVDNVKYSIGDWLFNSSSLIKHGSKKFVEALMNSTAGQIGPFNHGLYTLNIVKQIIRDSRTLRLQSYNQYRKKFQLPAFKSFMELTGNNVQLSKKLEEYYGDIDAVELFVGLMTEYREPVGSFGSGLTLIGITYSLHGLFSAYISSPEFWKPSTFGGDVGMDIIKEASLKNFICNNMPPPCDRVSFKTEGENTDVLIGETLYNNIEL